MKKNIFFLSCCIFINLYTMQQQLENNEQLKKIISAAHLREQKIKQITSLLHEICNDWKNLTEEESLDVTISILQKVEVLNEKSPIENKDEEINMLRQLAIDAYKTFTYYTKPEKEVDFTKCNAITLNNIIYEEFLKFKILKKHWIVQVQDLEEQNRILTEQLKEQTKNNT